MKIQSIRTITGPNVWHYRPVLIMLLELDNLTEVASSDIPGFKENLLRLLPGIMKHTCSPGYEGGFVERLERGTYFGHIVEHIALELSELANIGVKYGKTVYGGKEGLYQVVVRYTHEEAMKSCLKFAVEIAEAAVAGQEYLVAEKVAEIKKIVSRHSLGPSTLSIIQAAEKRNIPWSRLNGESLIQLGYGKYRRLIEATTTSLTSDISVRIAQDKDYAKKLLDDASIPVPRGMLVYSEAEAIEAFHSMGTQVAMKPFDGHHGNGVSLNISTIEEVKAAYQMASQHASAVIVEEFFKGDDFRVLIVGGKMIAASKRIPAHVVGDGNLSISDLVAEENKNPLRGEGHEKPMTLISMDESSILFLKKQGMTPESVPAAEEIIYLKETANLSTGGSAIDVTDIIHPEIKVMCERAARIVGLDVCGIDLIMESIKKSWVHQHGGVIEVNAGPGIRMHHYPSQGKVRDVGEAIIDYMYPDNHNGRIPILAVTGTNGKTTVSRLLAHMIKETGSIVGNTTTDGIFLDGIQIATGDTTGPISARTILNDPGVEVAVLETARGGIMKRGLAFDWCDVGIITNIEADHIGQDGIESIEDILRVKSLVVERVKENGTIVLNAESEHLMNLIGERKLSGLNREIVLFSLDENNEDFRTHVQSGKRGYFLRGDGLYEIRRGKETFLLKAQDIPLTVGGTARFHIANVLSAIPAAMVAGLNLEEIKEGLRSFHSGANSGRTNLFHTRKGYVLLDYGHNPEAIRSVGEMVASWNVSDVSVVLGAPGDRSDEMIRMSGEAAGKVFQHIIIREDEDLRDRAQGETANLLYEGIIQSNPKAFCQPILDPYQALERGLAQMKENDLMVYFYEDLAETEALLKKHGAKQVHDFSRLVPLSHGGHHQEISWH